MSIQIKIVEIFSSPINAYFVNLLKICKINNCGTNKVSSLEFSIRKKTLYKGFTVQT